MSSQSPRTRTAWCPALAGLSIRTISVRIGNEEDSESDEKLLAQHLPARWTDTAARGVDESDAGGQAWVFNGGLHPPTTSTIVRMKGDDLLITDGPFTEGKEHIGGFFIVKAPDLDAALEWARKAAKVITLPIEVRPFHGDVAH